MPSHPCPHPTCSAYVPRRGDFCSQHEEQGRQKRAERHRFYDAHQRNPEAKAFYNSAAWQRARASKLASEPVCQRCRRVFAAHVHHRVALARCDPAQRLDADNLMSVCQPCHSAIEAEAQRQNP